MDTELYNQLINQAKRGDQSLTGLFNISDHFYAEADKYKGLPEHVEACEEAGAEVYRMAISKQPRTATEAFILFDRLSEYLRPELDEVKEINPNVYAGFENLGKWISATMRLYASVEELLYRECSLEKE